MKINNFILLAYKAFDEKINGKTTLQKKIYFLGVLTEKIKELGYRPHYYGPYSANVELANNELKSFGYIEENTSNWGISNKGFEIIRYDYKLTETGRKKADIIEKDYPELKGEIDEAAEKIMDAGEIDYMLLSVAAKAYYILDKKNKEMTSKEIKKIAKKFRWSVNEPELKMAIKFLEKIKLVETS